MNLTIHINEYEYSTNPVAFRYISIPEINHVYPTHVSSNHQENFIQLYGWNNPQGVQIMCLYSNAALVKSKRISENEIWCDTMKSSPRNYDVNLLLDNNEKIYTDIGIIVHFYPTFSSITPCCGPPGTSIIHHYQV